MRVVVPFLMFFLGCSGSTKLLEDASLMGSDVLGPSANDGGLDAFRRVSDAPADDRASEPDTAQSAVDAPVPDSGAIIDGRQAPNQDADVTIDSPAATGTDGATDHSQAGPDAPVSEVPRADPDNICSPACGKAPDAAAQLAKSCAEVGPRIVAPGNYRFGLRDLGGPDTIACAYDIAGRRAGSFELCLDAPRIVELQLSAVPGSAGLFMSLTPDCIPSGPPGSCSMSGLSSWLARGRYRVTLGAYADADATVSVKLSQFPRITLPARANCELPSRCDEVAIENGVDYNVFLQESAASRIRPPSCAADDTNRFVAAFGLPQRAQVTLVSDKAFGYAVRAQCDGADIVCPTQVHGGYIKMHTILLDAGVYYLVGSFSGIAVNANGIRIVSEAPLPPDKNIDCASALEVSYGTRPRVVGGPKGKATTLPQEQTDTLRYYKIDHPGGTIDVEIKNQFDGSAVSAALRTRCEDPNSAIVQRAAPASQYALTALNLPAGIYYVVVASIEGSVYSLTRR